MVPLQELLTSIGLLEFNGGCAEISEVSNCSGDVSFHSFIHEMKMSLDRLRDLGKQLSLYSALKLVDDFISRICGMILCLA